MASAWPPLIVVVLTYCVRSAQPSLGPGKTTLYETECKSLRMGQFMCPDPAYEFIDPDTQQLRGCTRDGVAQGFCAFSPINFSYRSTMYRCVDFFFHFSSVQGERRHRVHGDQKLDVLERISVQMDVSVHVNGSSVPD